jgi:hypothetical protein
MSAENPISPKVIASTAGAGVGAALSALVIWILGVTVWDQAGGADSVNAAMAAVPAPVSNIIALLITAAVAAVSGWRVTDTHRVTTSDLRLLENTKAAHGG